MLKIVFVYMYLKKKFFFLKRWYISIVLLYNDKQTLMTALHCWPRSWELNRKDKNYLSSSDKMLLMDPWWLLANRGLPKICLKCYCSAMSWRQELIIQVKYQKTPKTGDDFEKIFSFLFHHSFMSIPRQVRQLLYCSQLTEQFSSMTHWFGN